MAFTFEDMKSGVEKDLGVDRSDLGTESLRSVQLHGKYLNFYFDAKLNLKKLRQGYLSLKKLKWEYYTGKISQEDLSAQKWEPFQLKILRTDVDLYMDADKDLQNLLLKVDYAEEKVVFLENVLKNINARQWNIRNAIDFLKFTNGIN